MLTRIITAVVSLIVFIGLLIAGETVFAIGVGIIILCMIYESFSAVTKSAGVKVSGYITGVIMGIGIIFSQVELAIAASIIQSLLFLIFMHEKVKYTEMFSAQFMAIYVTLFMSFIPRMEIEMGLPLMALIFIIAWGSDTAAYFCGTFLGKHKLIPKVSPKKTVEGSVGAVICTSLLCVLYMFILDKVGYGFMTATAGNYIRMAIVGLFASILSQFGDLAASAIKRDAQIKDYGWIFPGHGGFMDRFDSVLFIAPVVYYLCKFIII